jgi:hypothetical protein
MAAGIFPLLLKPLFLKEGIEKSPLYVGTIPLAFAGWCFDRSQGLKVLKVAGSALMYQYFHLLIEEIKLKVVSKERAAFIRAKRDNQSVGEKVDKKEKIEEKAQRLKEDLKKEDDLDYIKGIAANSIMYFAFSIDYKSMISALGTHMPEAYKEKGCEIVSYLITSSIIQSYINITSGLDDKSVSLADSLKGILILSLSSYAQKLAKGYLEERLGKDLSILASGAVNGAVSGSLSFMIDKLCTTKDNNVGNSGVDAKKGEDYFDKCIKGVDKCTNSAIYAYFSYLAGSYLGVEPSIFAECFAESIVEKTKGYFADAFINTIVAANKTICRA